MKYAICFCPQSRDNGDPYTCPSVTPRPTKKTRECPECGRDRPVVEMPEALMDELQDCFQDILDKWDSEAMNANEYYKELEEAKKEAGK